MKYEHFKKNLKGVQAKGRRALKGKKRSTGKDQKKKEKKNRKIKRRGRYFLITKKEKEKIDNSSMIVQRTEIKIRGKKNKTKQNWQRNENPCALAHEYSSLFNAWSFLL